MASKRLRILMFAPLCYPPAGAESIVTAKLVLAMIDASWKIKVISQSDFGQNYPISDNDDWKPLLSVVRNIPGFKDKGINLRFLRYEYNNKFRTISWIIKAILAGLAETKKEKYDFILSRATPQYGHLPALIVSKITGLPWIANWSDPMPPIKAPPPYGKGPQAKTSLLSKLYCNSVMQKSDWHTFPCERLMKYYWKIYPMIEKKSSVITHIALKRFCILQQKRNNVFTLCHTGTIGFRNPAVFFAGMKRFLAESKPTEAVQVLFIGAPEDEIRAKAQDAGVSDIVSVALPKTYEETQSLAASSSIVVVIEAQCEVGIFFPSKFVDFVQTGRPILAISPKVGTLCDILSAEGGGIAVDGRSPEAVAGALTILYRAWKNGNIDEKYGSERLYNLFSEDNVLNSYVMLFDRLDIR